MQKQHTPPHMSYDGNETIRALLAQASIGQPLAHDILYECVEGAKQQLLKAKHAGRQPGINSFFTGERLAWSWERTPPLGAAGQCLFLATLVYALIVTNAAPPHSVPLSQTGLFIDGEVLHDLMRFVATDDQLCFAAPFPYSQAEMKRAFEEHAAHSVPTKKK